MIIFILAGTIHSSRYKKRCSELMLIREALEEMAVMIRFRAVPVGELLSFVLGKEGYNSSIFLHKLRENYESVNIYNREMWDKALQDTYYLKDEDKEIIRSVGNNLGESDTEGQLSMLSIASEQLGKRLDTATSERLKNEKLVLSMWMFTGVGIGIMII